MSHIARTSAEIHLIVHYPSSENDKDALAERAACVHADIVKQSIKDLSCPSSQKAQLLDAVIKIVSARG